MTIKVVKRGNPPQEKKWKGTCSNCRSEVECLGSDITSFEAGDYRSLGPFSWEECPVCDAQMCFQPAKDKETSAYHRKNDTLGMDYV